MLGESESRQQRGDVPIIVEVLSVWFGAGGVLLLLHWLARAIPFIHRLGLV